MSKIDEKTLAILSRVTVEGNKILLTCGQLDRKQYEAVNKVLEAMGGKWNRKSRAHVFDEDPAGKLETVLLTGEIVSSREFGFFPTPPDIAKRIVELAEIEPHHKVLEPSAGKGDIVKFVPDCAELDCVEILPDNIPALQALGMSPFEGDFLSLEPNPTYDRIVANPPFSYKGHPQADIDHVLHMWECLTSGGRLVSVMSAGVKFRENKKTVEFRGLIDNYGWIAMDLPEGSFRASGTNVNTIIVILER